MTTQEHVEVTACPLFKGNVSLDSGGNRVHWASNKFLLPDVFVAISLVISVIVHLPLSGHPVGFHELICFKQQTKENNKRE